MNPIIIESPFKGDKLFTIEANLRYAQRAMLHALSIGEAPFLSHLLYPQVVPETVFGRGLGIAAGLTISKHFRTVVFYMDHGLSGGMRNACDRYFAEGKEIVFRVIGSVDSPLPGSEMLKHFDHLKGSRQNLVPNTGPWQESLDEGTISTDIRRA